MNKNQILPFLFLFFIIISLGCIGPLQTDKSKEEPEANKTVEGVLESKNLINGENKKTVTLISGQEAEIGVQVKNIGNSSLYNLSAKLIGIDGEPMKNEIDEMMAGQENYLFWTVEAPRMSSGEKITMPARIRAYFDYTSNGYTDLKIYPAGAEEVAPPIEHSDEKLIDLGFDMGVVRMIEGEDKSVEGSLNLKNVGPGWVDYPNYNKTKGHCQGNNLIRRVSLEVNSKEENPITFEEPEAGELTNGGKTLILKCNNLSTSNLYRLRMLDQSRLKIPFKLNIPESYSEEKYTGRIYAEVNYGYASKLTSANVILEG